jgi:hypothetical protein
MSTSRHSFKHNDAARLIRAAEAAGKKVKGMSLEGKRVTLQFDDDTKAKAEANDWADLKDATDEKRAS